MERSGRQEMHVLNTQSIHSQCYEVDQSGLYNSYRREVQMLRFCSGSS